MKRFISIILAVLITCSVLYGLGITASAAEIKSGDYKYVINSDNTAKITEYNSVITKSVDIPETIDGYSVTSLEAGCFVGGNITTVSVPATITTVSGNPFYKLENLANISVDEDSTAFVSKNGIMYSADMKSLVAYPTLKYAEFTIPEGVETVGTYAFANVKSLYFVNFPDSLNEIKRSAFLSSSLKSVDFGENEIFVHDSAFTNCDSITKLTIPKNVTLSYYTFAGCDGLENLEFNGSAVTAEIYLETCGHAFLNCSKLSSVTFGKDVTVVPFAIFKGCKALTKVEMSSSLEKIDSMAFEGCTSLEKIIIPDNVTAIGSSAFYNCINLKSVVLPENLERISSRTFRWCLNLVEIEIPQNCQAIGSEAFYNCKKLEKLVIPASVKTIEEEAFYNCKKLVSVKFDGYITTITNKSLGFYSVEVTSNGETYDKEYKNTDLVISGYDGSGADVYANKYEFTFDNLGKMPVTKINLKSYYKKLYVKGTSKIIATVTNPVGKTTFNSNTPSVAVVDEKGVVKAIKAGIARITVKNNSTKRTFIVEVLNPKLNKSKLTIKKGKTATINVIGKIGKVTYKSGNKNIATVKNNGKIFAKKKGSTKITVVANGITLKCRVIVK